MIATVLEATLYCIVLFHFYLTVSRAAEMQGGTECTGCSAQKVPHKLVDL